MKKAAMYTRASSSQGLDEKDQRDELLANLGDSHEIVGEYQKIANGSQDEGEKHGLSKLLDDAANGKVDVLVCSDLTRLTRRVTPEIIKALVKSGVRIVVKDGSLTGITDLLIAIAPRTFLEDQSRRIKRGIQTARERRRAGSESDEENQK